jgi:hypothetical protein
MIVPGTLIFIVCHSHRSGASCYIHRQQFKMVAQSPKRGRKGGALKLAMPLMLVGLVIIMARPSPGSYFYREFATISSAFETQAKESSLSEFAGICEDNPYAGSLHSSLTNVLSQADQWLGEKGMAIHLERAAQEEMKQHRHDRFFPFEVMAACDTSCVGGTCKGDVSKITCGIDKLQTEEKCVVYSVGGNNQWQFELDILKKTPCEVHTFDCTGDISRFKKPDDPRLTFHHVCLGSEHVPSAKKGKKCGGKGICGDILTLYQIQTMLGHTRIDLFKVRFVTCHSITFAQAPTLLFVSTKLTTFSPP